MKSRRRARELAIQGLYQYQYAGGDAAEIIDHLKELDGFDQADDELLERLVSGVIREIEALRARIQPHLARSWEQMSPVEKAVLLVGCFELMHAPDVPYRVVINEAIELAKRFGGTDGHKYVNGVLDRLAPEIRPGESRGNDTLAGQDAGNSGKSRRAMKGTAMGTTPASPEFDVIARHFARPARNAVLGVGDDCALVRVSNGMDLAVSTDTMISGTHFFPDVDPETLGHKALAVNLSDMAAMGAMPYWATLALTVPEIDHDWLEAFAKGFYDLADEFEVSLIGGDTTRGPLTLTVTIFGEVPAGAALKRSGARVGEDIWVSGMLGDAALAVAHRNGRLALDEDDYRNAVMRLYEPTPRVKLGQALRGVATAAIDISDGLVGDLGHICALSGLGATIETPLIPLSAIGKRHVATEEGLRAVLSGGDDYELCFTAPTNARESMEDLADMLDIPLTRIGRMHKGRGVSVLGADGKPLEIELQGFDNFAPA